VANAQLNTQKVIYVNTWVFSWKIKTVKHPGK